MSVSKLVSSRGPPLGDLLPFCFSAACKSLPVIWMWCNFQIGVQVIFCQPCMTSITYCSIPTREWVSNVGITFVIVQRLDLTALATRWNVHSVAGMKNLNNAGPLDACVMLWWSVVTQSWFVAYHFWVMLLVTSLSVIIYIIERMTAASSYTYVGIAEECSEWHSIKTLCYSLVASPKSWGLEIYGVWNWRGHFLCASTPQSLLNILWSPKTLSSSASSIARCNTGFCCLILHFTTQAGVHRYKCISFWR